MVAQHRGNYRGRHFSCWNQMMCMMFGQLSNRDGLRDLIVTINAHASKFYHLGFGKGVAKANLARANENRDCRIYQLFSEHLIAMARQVCISNEGGAFSFCNAVSMRLPPPPLIFV